MGNIKTLLVFGITKKPNWQHGIHSHEIITLNITCNVLFLPENCSRFIEKVSEFGYFRLKHLMQTRWSNIMDPRYFINKIKSPNNILCNSVIVTPDFFGL